MIKTPPSFWRSPRLKTPLPRDEVVIPDPPSDRSPETGSVLYYILPTVAMAAVMIVVSLATGMQSMLAFSVPMILMSGGVSAGIFVMQRRKARTATAQRQQRYHALLNDADAHLARLHKQQILLRDDNDPPLPESLRRVRELDRRLWSRLPADEDFLCVRLGIGDMPSTVTVKTPTSHDAVSPDPLLLEAVQVARQYAIAPDVPITLDVRASEVIGIAGDRTRALHLAFALILNVATYHAPGEVQIAALYPAHECEKWAWMRWLPHTWSEDGALRYMADDDDRATRLMTAIDRLLDARRRFAANTSDEREKNDAPPPLIVFIANDRIMEQNPVVERLQYEGPGLGIFPVFIATRTKTLPQACRVTIRLTDAQAHLLQQGVISTGTIFVPDSASDDLTQAFALAMAPIRLRQLASREIPQLVTFLDQLKVESVAELHVVERWNHSALDRQKLAAPIGTAAGREPLYLDLHEKADGPNGLVAGMVGAGKSELLQTLVASLAVEYHPHRLSFVLIDYKGGGMADPFISLPHTLGVITNLQQEGLARRALTSLTLELERRQLHFKQADVTHIDDYQRKYDEGRLAADAEPIPYLLVIVDEFAEMKTEQPEVAKEFVRIARLGRALGFRLILAMQKPAGIVDGQIEANTRFRLCLRVAQTEDSVAMLKRPDAAYLAGRGRCLVQVGTNEKFREFQVAWAGAPHDPQRAARTDPREISLIALEGTRRLLTEKREVAPADEQTQLRAVVEHLAEVATQIAAKRLPMLWLPPLPASLTLEEVRPNEGWDGSIWRPATSWLSPVVGLLDRPRERVQSPYLVPLGREGHLAIYSAPGYGKTTALHSLITSVALTYAPDDVHMYLLDFGGRLLKVFERLPHVGAVVTADETERLERLALFLRRNLEERRDLLGASGVNNLPAYRESTGSKLPALVVVLDNYANYIEAAGENESLITLITRLAQDGTNLGIHLVLTANNSATIRFAVSSNVMLALAMHMVEPGEYGAVVGRTEGMELAPLPGRAFVRGNPVVECQIALPIKGATDAARSQNLRALVGRMDQAWDGARPAPINVLPEVVRLESLEKASTPATLASAGLKTVRLPIGVNADDLSTLVLDLGVISHLLVAGPSQSGRSTLLRTWARSLAATESAEECRIYVIDSKRNSLAPLRALPHVAGYACDPQESDALLRAVNASIGEMQQKRRAGLPTPRITILIDDLWETYDDTVSSDGKDLVGRLISDGRGLPFHLLVGGRLSDLASKSWAEPVKSLKEGQCGIVLGTGDDALFNTRLSFQERNRSLPVGEGYYIQRGLVQRVKIAVSD